MFIHQSWALSGAFTIITLWSHYVVQFISRNWFLSNVTNGHLLLFSSWSCPTLMLTWSTMIWDCHTETRLTTKSPLMQLWPQRNTMWRLSAQQSLLMRNVSKVIYDDGILSHMNITKVVNIIYFCSCIERWWIWWFDVYGFLCFWF